MFQLVACHTQQKPDLQARLEFVQFHPGLWCLLLVSPRLAVEFLFAFRDKEIVVA